MEKVLLVLSRFKALSHLLFLSSHAREKKRNHPTGSQIWPKAKYEANVIKFGLQKLTLLEKKKRRRRKRREGGSVLHPLRST